MIRFFNSTLFASAFFLTIFISVLTIGFNGGRWIKEYQIAMALKQRDYTTLQTLYGATLNKRIAEHVFQNRIKSKEEAMTLMDLLVYADGIDLAQYVICIHAFNHFGRKDVLDVVGFAKRFQKLSMSLGFLKSYGEKHGMSYVRHGI